MVDGETFEQELDKQAYTGNPLFTSEGVAPSVIGETLSDKYGQEWLGWSPQTLRPTLEKDFRTDIHPVSWDKILAVQACLMVDDPWIEWNIFSVVVKAFNNQVPSFDQAMACSPGEMAWACSEMRKIRDEKFGDEVVLYVRACCLEQGLLVFPEELSFAQGDLDQRGKDIQAAWVEKSKQLNFPVSEDLEGIQLARLNSIRHYMRSMQGESDKAVLQSEGKW